MHFYIDHMTRMPHLRPPISALSRSIALTVLSFIFDTLAKVMRLLRLANDHTSKLVQYADNEQLPEYAILSHIWGREDEEPTYADLMAGTAMHKSGYRKLVF